MPVAPQLYSVSRPVIVRNLIAFVEENQIEYLAWAVTQTGYTGGEVEPFTKVFNSSAGVKATFPNLNLVNRRTEFGRSDDGVSLQVRHTLGWMMMVTDSDPDALTDKVEVYSAALKAMLWNCPRATLMEGVTTQGHPTVDVLDDNADETRGESLYLQAPRVVMTVEFLEVQENG